jgi:MEMO1 family protein
MRTRTPSVAGAFYPGTAREARQQLDAFLQQATVQVTGRVVAGIVPHAGWLFSGLTAAHLFRALQDQAPPETVILFGAVHRWPLRAPALYGSGAWRTPLGEVAVDQELAQALREADPRFEDQPEAHEEEHSIEVQVPFVQRLWPDAHILPIAMPPLRESPDLGRAVAQAAQSLAREVVAIGSTDLTHYGPGYGMAPAGVGPQGLDWAKENDRRFLERVTALDAEGALAEARSHHNACGPGAVAAAIGYALEMGATRAALLHHTTSHEAHPMGRPTDLVGYGAVALVA